MNLVVVRLDLRRLESEAAPAHQALQEEPDQQSKNITCPEDLKILPIMWRDVAYEERCELGKKSVIEMLPQYKKNKMHVQIIVD